MLNKGVDTMDGEFDPVYSTNNIWWDDEFDQCLTLHLEDMEDDISDLQTGKADANHTHTGYATTTYVDNKVAGLVNSAPTTLDTLSELASALGNDPNFATTIATQIGNKVTAVEGMGLSSNDFTTAEKNKLSGIEAGANQTTVDSSLSSTSTNPVQNKIVNSAIDSLTSLITDLQNRVTALENALNSKEYLVTNVTLGN